MASSFKPSVIIDAGAYVGYSSVYFAQKYRQARIIALEPVRANFDLLVRNTSAHPRILARNQALWSSVTSATMSDQQQGFWAFAITEADASDARAIAGVNTTTIDEIVREFDIQTIDLLKLDIEGSEKEVLEHSGTWIDQVAVIAIELHDRFKPGCSAALEAATGDFRFTRKNDMTVFRSRREAV